jgi:outer membrane protein assembly factor BamE (lipoprotein component of BamABCDE complex)
MKRPIKIVLVTAMSVVVLLFVGGFIYFHFFFELDIFNPGPIMGVQPEAWAKLQVGMTKQDVIALLGESQRQVGPTTTETDGKKEIMMPEFWAYTWTEGLDLFVPSDKAHAVYFDSDGKVSSFRAPKTANSSNQSLE